LKKRSQKLLLVGLVFYAVGARAQIPGQDPDWPCAQRLVEVLSPGAYWNGRVPEHTGWRDDEILFPLVTEIVDRDTPDAAALAKLDTYVAAIPQADRTTKLPALFSAIVDQTNDERSLLIRRLEKIGRRQRAMGEKIATLSNEVDALKDTDPKRDDLAGARDFDVRAFGETQHMVRYACEAPAAMERRLGVFARDLQAKMKQGAR
jgi:hypothetical protein